MARWYSTTLVFLIIWLITASCAARAGYYHRVKKGETLYRISKAYGLPMDKIASANNMRDKGMLRTGQYLYIPGKSAQAKVAPPPRPSSRSKHHASNPPYRRPAPRVENLSGRFSWPIADKRYHQVFRKFGKHGRKRNTGVHIKAPPGTSVVASSAGEVVYAGDDLQGYGNTIIIRHPEEIFSVYSFLMAVQVKTGDKVARGDLIGRVGRPPVPQFGSYQAMLHFELRERTIPVNPENILP